MQDAATQLIFRRFKKTDISLDCFLLKLSFHDLQIFRQIFEHNVKLIRQRSEKMTQAAEESMSAYDEKTGGS